MVKMPEKSHNRMNDSKDVPKSYKDDIIEPRHSKITPESIIEKVLSNKSSTYLPPSKLRLLQSQITDKTSVAYQRMNWMNLKKKINGLINKVNVSNVQNIALNLLEYNIIRGRGVVVQSLMRAQVLSTVFTNVYASLLAIINSKFPQIGELLVKRLVVLFRKAFKRNDKDVCLSSIKFIAHLINQRVAHEILALDILTILLENPTDDSIEVAIGFLKECGLKMKDIAPQGLRLISDQLRTILHESLIADRTQMLIDTYFQIYKDNFKDYPSVLEDLNLIDEEDQFTHMVTLDEEIDTQEILNVFKYDKNFESAELKYEDIKKKILPGSDEEDESGNESEGGEGEEPEDESKVIVDSTETNIIAFRRTIYLTIHSSLSHDECAHKLLKMDIKPGLEEELAAMILDCCAQERTYKKFFGLLAERFCKIDQKYQELYEKIFGQSYLTVHRLEGIKIKNMAKFFAHLFDSDAISWKCFECVQITNPDTTSSSRIFIKCIFQELAEFMGMEKLKERLSDPFLETSYLGLFPRDDPQNTIMAINFFTTIGLGPLTEGLRAHLAAVKEEQKRANAEKEQEMLLQAAALQALASQSSDDDSDSSESSDSDNEVAPKAKASIKQQETVRKHPNTKNENSESSRNLQVNEQKHNNSQPKQGHLKTRHQLSSQQEPAANLSGFPSYKAPTALPKEDRKNPGTMAHGKRKMQTRERCDQLKKDVADLENNDSIERNPPSPDKHRSKHDTSRNRHKKRDDDNVKKEHKKRTRKSSTPRKSKERAKKGPHRKEKENKDHKKKHRH